MIEYREGGEQATVRKLPGRIGYRPAALSRGVDGNRELYDWWRSAEQGRLQRRSVSIVLLDDAREPVKRWNIHNAWPQRYTLGDLDASGSAVLMETIELAYESFELA